MTGTRRGVLAGLTVFWSPVWAVFAVWRALEGVKRFLAGRRNVDGGLCFVFTSSVVDTKPHRPQRTVRIDAGSTV
jgi:hypothetical protein